MPSRDIFFSDHILFSAQADVLQMTEMERSSLGLTIDLCTGTLSANEGRRLRCEMAMLRYLINFVSTGNSIALDAVQFMTSLVRYNKAIGRQNEAGLDSRLGSIHHRLRDAIRIAQQTASARAAD